MNNHRQSSNRWIAILVFLLVLGAAWAFLSREPVAPADGTGGPPSPNEGFAAPDFTLETLGGSQVTLSELRGHPVVINFWASWCPPCRAEMPAIEDAYQRYQAEGLVVVGMNLTAQDTESAASGFVQEFGLTFPIALDPDGFVSDRYQLRGLPSTYFIDREGIIRSVVVGGPMSEAMLQANIEDLLGD